MKHIKVIFENGDYIKSKINGTNEEINDYYLNNYFNIGSINDDIQKCVGVQFV